jgi:hydroxymethylbilane synthase
MSTAGDLNKVTPLYQFDAKALWTRELEVALLEGEIDMIVHSLKDMPTTLPEGCALGAITQREDPRDTAVFKAGLEHCKTLDDLPEGSVVGTSSVRRIAQLRRAYPHLQFADVRGNVDTRLRKLDHSTDPDYSAIILAEAGLTRMGIQRNRIQLAGPTLLHAVGQGSLGVEIRIKDNKTSELLKPLNHRESRLRCLAERSLMRALEGGCSVPIGVETEMKDDKHLTLKAILVTVDGEQAINGEGSVTFGEGEEEDDAAERLGLEVASNMKAAGAQDLLESIRLEKEEHLEKGTDVIGNDEPPAASVDNDVGEKTVVESDLPPVLKALAAKRTVT